MTTSSDSCPLAEARRNGWIDLAAEALGGRAMLANDEFFAPKECLLRSDPAVFIADRYTDRGKWMDGWESRRRRTPGHDWCIIRLGIPGVVHSVVVDTAHFRGNHPASASLESIEAPPDVAADALADDSRWRPLAIRTDLAGDTANRLATSDLERSTHVRLNIFPDGGVARLRVFGEVAPDWPRLMAAVAGPERATLDMASVVNGGRIVACSDAFFSQPLNMLKPGDGTSMADGWETRRRRGPGHDWAVIALGRPAMLERAILDTRYFKGNFPESAALSGCLVDGGSSIAMDAAVDGADDQRWRVLAAKTPLGPDAEHGWALDCPEPVSHVRLEIFPDGGVSRLRLLGTPTGD